MKEAPDIYRIHRQLGWALVGVGSATGMLTGLFIVGIGDPRLPEAVIAKVGFAVLWLAIAMVLLFLARRALGRLIAYHEYLSENVRVVAVEVPPDTEDVELHVVAKRVDRTNVN